MITPIELKLTSYPYKDNHDFYYIQCKTVDVVLESNIPTGLNSLIYGEPLYHPNEDPTLYVLYLALDQIQLKWDLEDIKQSVSTFLTQSDMKFLKQSINYRDHMTKVFDTLIIYKLWIDKWNAKYGSIYKLII